VACKLKNICGIFNRGLCITTKFNCQIYPELYKSYEAEEVRRNGIRINNGTEAERAGSELVGVEESA